MCIVHVMSGGGGWWVGGGGGGVNLFLAESQLLADRFSPTWAGPASRLPTTRHTQAPPSWHGVLRNPLSNQIGCGENALKCVFSCVKNVTNMISFTGSLSLCTLPCMTTYTGTLYCISPN